MRKAKRFLIRLQIYDPAESMKFIDELLTAPYFGTLELEHLVSRNIRFAYFAIALRPWGDDLPNDGARLGMKQRCDIKRVLTGGLKWRDGLGPPDLP